jgi:hypothetical protein
VGAVSGGGVAADAGFGFFAHTSSRSESKQKDATVPPQTTGFTPTGTHQTPLRPPMKAEA